MLGECPEVVNRLPRRGGCVSSVPPVYCPECRSEYLGTATQCSECGVALVTEGALGDAGAPELPPVSELVCVRAASVGCSTGTPSTHSTG